MTGLRPLRGLAKPVPGPSLHLLQLLTVAFALCRFENSGVSNPQVRAFFPQAG
jgi:hypothetical protein